MSTPAEPTLEVEPRPLSSARWVLGLLFAGNLLNFYDRALPSVVLEQIKNDFGLDDAQVGVLASAFVLVAALAGVPLGRLADRIPRRTVAGWGLIVWSLFTAVGGIFSSFWVFLASRVGVGVGEASYSPATGSLIADLYPSERRSRATALFTLGFPIGTLLAFFTAGAIAEALGSWRAPFLIAAVPGLVVAVLILRIHEPRRGASDAIPTVTDDRPVSTSTKGASIADLLRIRSLYGLTLAFAGYNFAAYAIGTFITPVLQRYYGLGLIPAASTSGVIIGVAGLIGLLVGGRVLDRARARSTTARDRASAACLALAAVSSFVGLAAAPSALWQLVLFMSLGYLLGIVYLASFVPATADVVAPEQRSTALGLIFAVGYLIGGAGGPICVGLLSDSLAGSAGSLAAAEASAHGLRTAMAVLVPVAFAVAAVGMLLAARSAPADRAKMLARGVAS